jgi:hypothetical protein
LFSKHSFDWLQLKPLLASHRSFQTYFQFGSKDALTDEVTLETFRNLLDQFAHSPKSHVRLILPQIEVYFTHDRYSVEELINSAIGEKKGLDEGVRNTKINSFCVIRAKNKVHQLLNKIRDKKIKFLEIQRNPKFEEAEIEDYLVTQGKRIALFAQVLVDFLTSPGSGFFEVFSNLPFDNGTQKKVNFEFKRFGKGVVTVDDKWQLAEKIVRGSGQDTAKYKLVGDKTKKDQAIRLMDPSLEGTYGVFFGGEVFGKELARLLRFVHANNPDVRLIVE